jgi:hypothetical protein
LAIDVYMRALILSATTAAILTTSPKAPAIAADFPVYSPEGWCMDAARAKGGTPDEGVFRSCLDQEQQGYDSVKTRWPSLSAYTQTWCNEIAFGGSRNGSYLALDDCVKARGINETSPPQQFRW